jgi:magnesium-protoporphyrin O-methyltransferase
MGALSYEQRRGQIETYFDRTAVDAWARLTSEAPVGSVRATVRAGRDAMRRELLDRLPDDLRGMRLLDAGCGTGALAVEAARRGADVHAIDLSPTLVGLARERAPRDLGQGRITFAAGDMLDPALGRFDYAVAMDSLIHYRAAEVVRMLGALADRVERSIVFTFAPRTQLLAVMHAVGKLFPRGDRSPAIEPVAEAKLRKLIAADPRLAGWHSTRSHRITSGFYISQAMEVVRR